MAISMATHSSLPTRVLQSNMASITTPLMPSGFKAKATRKNRRRNVFMINYLKIDKDTYDTAKICAMFQFYL